MINLLNSKYPPNQFPMKTQNTKHKYVGVFVVLIMLFSCSESNDVGVQTPIDVNERNVVADNMKAGIAKALALKMSNNQLRKFVKTEIARQFDGDNNFLITEALDKTIFESVNGKTRSFKSILFGEKSDESWRVKKDSLFEFNPLIQIAVPSLPNFSNENWDTETIIPLVAYNQ